MFSQETNARHQALIDQLISDVPGAAVYGFLSAVNELRTRLGCEAIPPLQWRPDAYRINVETEEIEIYEVEVRHAIPSSKIDLLGEFWLDWDDEGEHDWLPVLIVVGRYGARQRIDLKHAHYRTGPFTA